MVGQCKNKRIFEREFKTEINKAKNIESIYRFSDTRNIKFTSGYVSRESSLIIGQSGRCFPHYIDITSNNETFKDAH